MTADQTIFVMVGDDDHHFSILTKEGSHVLLREN
jgi:hypothetical protein